MLQSPVNASKWILSCNKLSLFSGQPGESSWTCSPHHSSLRINRSLRSRPTDIKSGIVLHMKFTWCINTKSKLRQVTKKVTSRSMWKLSWTRISSLSWSHLVLGLVEDLVLLQYSTTGLHVARNHWLLADPTYHRLSAHLRHTSPMSKKGLYVWVGHSSLPLKGLPCHKSNKQ